MEINSLNTGFNNAQAPQAVNQNEPSDQKPGQGVVIEIKPTEGNVSQGDRSSNSATVSITTPNREASTEITREQFFNGVERRALQNSLTGTGGIAQPDPELAALNFQKSLAQTYAASYTNSLNPYNSTGSSSYSPAPYSAAPANGAALYNQALDTYVKQTLFFSAADQAGSSFSSKA